MRIADLPGPSNVAEPWLTSLEPWQRDGILRLREALGVDADALVRAGVTLVLSLVAVQVPPQTDASPRRERTGAKGLKAATR